MILYFIFIHVFALIYINSLIFLNIFYFLITYEYIYHYPCILKCKIPICLKLFHHTIKSAINECAKTYLYVYFLVYVLCIENIIKDNIFNMWYYSINKINQKEV